VHDNRIFANLLLRAPKPFFWRSNMPVTMTVGDMAERRKPDMPANRNGIP
jgi:hypothetical protein